MWFSDVHTEQTVKLWLENHDDLESHDTLILKAVLHAERHAIFGKEDKTTRLCGFRTLRYYGVVQAVFW